MRLESQLEVAQSLAWLAARVVNFLIVSVIVRATLEVHTEF